ncbi:MAG TPA: zinc ribbon domain-containing protein [Blastocatellia bacterium]|nr:zinc ribbon domain-containing protein [Blastocatellia bacterium]
MYCPKCGGEAVESQRFCKSCGTNLQLINNAIKTGDGAQGPFGIDVETLKQSAMDFATSWKTSWAGVKQEHEKHRKGDWSGFSQAQIRREQRRATQDEIRRRNLPRPKEWMSYSWQHNLKSGLISLLTGAGLGFLLYNLGQGAISSGVLETIPELSQPQINGVARLASLLWLIALIPMLKGLGQIIYAAFFAESMAKLSDRYTVRLEPRTEPITGSLNSQEPPQQAFDELKEPPASVTENTTKFFEEARAQTRRESQ